MHKVELQPQSISPILHTSESDRFLVIRSATAFVYVRDTSSNRTYVMMSGDTIALESMRAFVFENIHSIANHVEYQLSDKALSIAPSSSVSIKERVTVESILGTVDCQVRNNRNMQSLDDVVVGAGQVVQICRGSSIRHELIIQNISPKFAAVRLGCSGVGSGRGLLLGGSIAAPQTATLTTGGAVFVYNSADVDAVLAVMEVRQ